MMTDVILTAVTDGNGAGADATLTAVIDGSASAGGGDGIGKGKVDNGDVAERKGSGIGDGGDANDGNEGGGNGVDTDGKKGGLGKDADIVSVKDDDKKAEEGVKTNRADGEGEEKEGLDGNATEKGEKTNI